MIFSEESITNILNGNKTMTRRLVKPNEIFSGDSSPDYYCTLNVVFNTKSQRVKWQVGNKYAVCPGRGKPQIWYCSKCNAYSIDKNWKHFHEGEPKLLFIELVSIRQEKLLDITEADAEKEGFRYDLKFDITAKKQFIDKFYTINKLLKIKTLYGLRCCTGIKKGKENPDVWVIEFKKVD